MRFPLLIALAALISAAATADPIPGQTIEVTCGIERVVVKSNQASLEEILTRLSRCLDFELKGTDKLKTVIFRAPEVSGSPGRVLKTVLEGINVLIVGDEQRIERVIILSADQGFIPPTEDLGEAHDNDADSPGTGPRQSTPGNRAIDLTRIEPDPDNFDDSTTSAEPASTLTDTLERRALGAVHAAGTKSATDGNDTRGVADSSDPQDYLPELTRQSQEQLKALIDALNRAGDP